MHTHSSSASHKNSIKAVKWLAVIIVFLLVTGIITYFFLPIDRLLESKLKTWLHTQGIDAEFTLSTLSTTELGIRNASLAPENAIAFDSLSATYSFAELSRGKIDHVQLSGLKATVTETAEGQPNISGLETLLNNGNTIPDEKGFILPALPFDTLTAENSQIFYKRLNGEIIRLVGDVTLHNTYTGEIRITEASLPLGEEEIILSNILLKRTEPDAPFIFTLENIAHITSKKAYFSPLSAEGEITLARDYRALNSTITIHDLRQLWALNLKADAQLDAGTWNVIFEQPPMQFESGIIQPDMLFPVLRGAVSQVGGTISIKGNAGKDAEGDMHSTATLTFGNLAATIKDVPVNGVNGNVELSSLYPPATQGKQTLRINEIVLGLPLKNGKMAFTLNEDGKVMFQPSTWQWAGGELKTAGASLNLYKPSLPDVTLSAKGLALEELLSSLLQKGISATGKLSGVLPIHFTKDHEAMIRKGSLVAEAGGVVRYTPTNDSPLQKGSSFQTDLLLSAMENFHYDVLTMNINSKTEHEVEVLLHVKGRNPQLYDGQTIELNINLNGNLLDIVQSGMNVYTLPERLQEQLMQ
jgi:hypothetical protein